MQRTALLVAALLAAVCRSLDDDTANAVPIDLRKPAPGRKQYLDDLGAAEDPPPKGEEPTPAAIPSTEFRAARFGVHLELKKMKPLPRDFDVAGIPILRSDLDLAETRTDPTFDSGFQKLPLMPKLNFGLPGAAGEAVEGVANKILQPANKILRAGLQAADKGLDTLPAGVRHDLPAVVPAAAGAYLLNSFLQEDYNSLCGPPELHGQSLHVCVPFGAMPSTMLSQEDAEKNPLQPIEKIERFGGATPPVVVASVETGCVPDAKGSCTPLDGRYVVNLVSVHFDHFEAVISRIDKPFSFQLSDSDELWLSWFAYGFAQPATGGEQGEIDEAYNEPLRPLLHTLPARAAGGYDALNPQKHYDPFAGEAHGNPLSPRFAFGAKDDEGRARFHGFDVPSVAAAQRQQCDDDKELQALRSNPLQTVGIAGAPGFQPTPKWAQVTDEMRPPTVQKGGNPVPAPNLDTTLQKDVPPPKRPPVEPKRGEKGGYLTGILREAPAASVPGTLKVPPKDPTTAQPKQDLERRAPPKATPRRPEPPPRQSEPPPRRRPPPSVFAAAAVRGGEARVLRPQLPDGASPPLSWEAGPGAWPDWIRIDGTSGAVTAAPPRGAPAGEVAANVTAVELDASAVDGLARRVWSLNVTVVAPAAFVEVES